MKINQTPTTNYSVLALATLVAALVAFSFLFSPATFLRLALGLAYAFFLPGLALSHLFFKGERVSLVERVTVSFAFSVAIVPLATFYLTVVGLGVTGLNVAIIVGVLTVSVLAAGRLNKHRLLP